MSDQDNDRLEEFFRKATSKPDVAFNEEDWKKLEARLDTHDALMGGGKTSGIKLITAVAVSAIVLFTGGLLVIDHYRSASSAETVAEERLIGENDISAGVATPGRTGGSEGRNVPELSTGEGTESVAAPVATGETARPGDEHRSLEIDRFASGAQTGRENADNRGDSDVSAAEKNRTASTHRQAIMRGVGIIDDEQIVRDFIQISPALAEKHKQKAKVKLPGAEEVETGEAESVVREEQVSDQVDHVTTPRLSLLLSFAPDFSGTSLSQYSTPGKAFGAMIHYHLGKRWSISAGVIKNNKQYTGNGEDYKPPTGYWKYYTNGKIPTSIYGSCDVLEFPVMAQYAVFQNEKNRLLAGAGTSSYVMLTESYQYYFDEPNPGAREGWDAKKSSRFWLNMVNFTVAYERQVLPGLMIGVEPYVKIPIEEIGWVNLKLFSTGASVTMRYTLLRKKDLSVASRSRGPD